MAVIVNKSRCPQNHPCPSVRKCPKNALKQSNFNAPVVDKDNCVDCGICVDFCPKGALMMKS